MKGWLCGFWVLVCVVSVGCGPSPADEASRLVREPSTNGFLDAGVDVVEDVGEDASIDASGVDVGGDGSSESEPGFASSWEVVVSSTAPEGVQLAASDVVKYLKAMGQDAVLVGDVGGAEVGCEAGVGRVVFFGDGVGGFEVEGGERNNDQTWRVRETRCDATEERPARGVKVELAGGGLLGRQYAAYEYLHHLGVRFFHPEEEFVPEAPLWSARAWERQHTPDFRWRSVSLHLTHPIELGDPFREGDEDLYPEVGRYIDWQIKNLASHGHSGVGPRGVVWSGYGLRRGFGRASGFSLHNQQQGASNIVNPDDPRPAVEQIAEAIDARMDVPAEEVPQFFGFTFNPSEFTEIDDIEAVEQMTFIAEYFAERYPETILTVINHGTAGEPTPNYGVRYYDLPQFAPENLGVRVHTLMFYDLFRPAPVYGNEDFNYLYDFMVQEYQKRRIWHYPEAAWWLTFDIAVPLYLPVTIDARYQDIQGIKFMLNGKLDGHRVFGTGHEWGYWQNEYCSFRMSADVEYTDLDCYRDIALPAGPEAAPVVVDVLQEVVRLQERDMIYGDILRYLVGTDPETEAAFAAGIDFHPLPPAIPAVMQWTPEQIERWTVRDAPQLAQMAEDYALLTERLEAVQGTVSERGRPWFDEVLDGVEVTGLRARHALHVYGALVKLRQSRLESSEELRAEADALLDVAKADTRAALAVVRRREQGYRYQPISRAIAGGVDGTEDENWTVYRYRYLNRTHHAYYYTRIDELVEEAFAGSSDPIDIDDTILTEQESLQVAVLDVNLEGVSAEFGDGAVGDEARQFQHMYDAVGVYTLVLSGVDAAVGEPYVFRADVARVEREVSTGYAGRILEPSGAALIETLLPGVVLGFLDEGRVALGFDVRGTGKIGPGGWSLVSGSLGDDGSIATQPASFPVPIVNRSTQSALASIGVRDMVLSRVEEEASLFLEGQLSTQGIVDAVVAVGGFEPDGARGIVASTLGYTSETMPEEVLFRVEFAP